MRRIFNQRLFVYVLCATLLLTLGMEFKAPAQSSGRSLVTSQTLNHSQVRLEIKKWTQWMFDAFTQSHVRAKKGLRSLAQASDSFKKATPIKVVKKPVITTYKVTADYLNIRTGPTVESKRMKVVKQGTMLTVVQTTKEGWLQLKSGGYVHGGYAERIHNDSNPSRSLEGNMVRRAPVPKPQLIPKPKPKPIPIPKPTPKPIPKPKPKPQEPSKPTSMVKSDSGLTEAHIAQLFKGTALAGHDLESTILEVEDEYGINAYFTIAVMKLESGNGKSSLAKNKNNLFGLNATGGNNKNANSFKTKNASVERFGQLLSKNYVKKGFTTIEKVGTKYCPSNPDWPSLVKNIIKRDYNKL